MMNFNLNVGSKIAETCVGTSVVLRRFASLNLIEKEMRSMNWLETPTVFFG